MTAFVGRPQRLVTLAVLTTLLVLTARAPAEAAERRCFEAAARRHKTSLGVHQWTVRQVSTWCVRRRAGRWRSVDVRRRARVRTGTNWKLVSRAGYLRDDPGPSITAGSRFHFRLRYPQFEQNCYPRLEVTMWPSGEFDRVVRTGC